MPNNGTFDGVWIGSTETTYPRRHWLWVGLVAAVCLLITFTALTFVYVEGDDAYTIAHHLLGRDRTFQPAYSLYHSMMDTLLGFLPAREGLLRIFSIGFSTIALFFLLTVVFRLLFDWLGIRYGETKLYMSLVLMGAVPELFYLGLIYSPSLVAMAFVVTAHVVLRRRLKRVGPALAGPQDLWIFLTSLALFGFGAAFRWDIVAYGAVIVVDLMTGIGWRRMDGSLKRIRIAFGIGWGSMALAFFLFFILLSGYDLNVIGDAVTKGSSISNDAPSLFSPHTLASLTSFFSPGGVLLACLGLFRMIKIRSRLGYVVLISILVVLPWVGYGTPKFLLPVLPAYLACVIEGTMWLWYSLHSRFLRAAGRAVVVLLLLGPWLCGMAVTYGDAAWGPAFKLQPYDRPAPTGMTVAPVLGAGFALPTPEGPRPLGGHLWALMGGDWRQLVKKLAAERRAAIATAVERGLPLVVVKGGTGFQVTELHRLGFRTRDAFSSRPSGVPELRMRRFTRADGKTLHLVQSLVTVDELWAPEGHARILREIPGDGELVVMGYPSSLRRLHQIAPESLTKLGPSTAVFSIPSATQLEPAPSSPD